VKCGRVVWCPSKGALPRFGSTADRYRKAVHYNSRGNVIWTPVLGSWRLLQEVLEPPVLVPICIAVPNFVQVGQAVPEIWPFFDGGRPPSWICHTPVWTTHEVYFGGLCHCAKFGLNRCSSFNNMQVLIFCRRVTKGYTGHQYAQLVCAGAPAANGVTEIRPWHHLVAAGRGQTAPPHGVLAVTAL